MRARKLDEVEAHSLLLEGLEHAAHFLPEQAPIHAFVHHNTLHAFEHLPFYEGVEEAARILGARPYPNDELFARYISENAISDDDLRAAIHQSFAEDELSAALAGVSYEEFVFTRLKTLPQAVDENAVKFLIREERLFSDFHVGVAKAEACEPPKVMRFRSSKSERRPHQLDFRELWNRLEEASHGSRKTVDEPLRRRDLLLKEYGVDADALLHPLLIRLSAAFLDQGLSYWTMPERELGFFECFVRLYSQPIGCPDRWLDELGDTLRLYSANKLSAEDACVAALERLQVPQAQWSRYIQETLLSLRGWAGMFRQFESRPANAPMEPVPARLLDFLAVSLTLEAEAAIHVWRECNPSARVPAFSLLGSSRSRSDSMGPDLELVYAAYVMAQLTHVCLDSFREREICEAWLDWNRGLNANLRGRLLHRAFERNYLNSLTSAISAHQEWLARRAQPTIEYQAVFCIDDREESYRRHLEEVDPGVSTYSFPGFFGVAMRYYAAGDVRPRDLCPVVTRPTHVVRETTEEVVFRRNLGASYHLHVGTTTLLRGFLLSGLGLIAVIPLVLAVLFPRWFRFRRKKQDEPTTKIKFAREPTFDHDDGRRDDELPEGYTPEEMSQLVESLLTQMGLKEGFSPLVLIIGHGSSSTNNPHLAAYGCGATAGGCGGPNARVIAQMANRKDVRGLLARRGIVIPESTWFVPGMHDTCSDDIHLYEQDGIGERARELLVRAKASMEAASRNNAHERCRLFAQVSLQIPPEKAKSIVESRSVDLSEARPEYNHAKNSCCFVGRRELTRGLFLDQRAFLASYDPKGDDDGAILSRVLLGSVPVGMGINLEYLFGTVDNQAYGAGSKLPHNVSGLLGVMDGHSSDLRTGLYNQMIELHEPMRLVSIVESTPAILEKILNEQPHLKQLAQNGWFRLLCFDSRELGFFLYEDGRFSPLPAAEKQTAERPDSRSAYAGQRGRVPLFHVEASFRAGAA